jgi:hypothetical protein
MAGDGVVGRVIRDRLWRVIYVLALLALPFVARP